VMGTAGVVWMVGKHGMGFVTSGKTEDVEHVLD